MQNDNNKKTKNKIINKLKKLLRGNSTIDIANCNNIEFDNSNGKISEIVVVSDDNSNVFDNSNGKISEIVVESDDNSNVDKLGSDNKSCTFAKKTQYKKPCYLSSDNFVSKESSDSLGCDGNANSIEMKVNKASDYGNKSLICDTKNVTISGANKSFLIGNGFKRVTKKQPDKAVTIAIDYMAVTKDIEKAYEGTTDLVRLNFEIVGKSCAIYFIDGLIDKVLFEDHILKPLKSLEVFELPYLECLNNRTMMTTAIKVEFDTKNAINTIAGGDIVVVIGGAEAMFVYSEKKFATRAIQEPPVSNVLRGPREGFVEDIKTNVTMVRRRLATPELRLENMKVGKYTATKICLAYINNIADKKIVQQVRDKISGICIDGVIESSYIARYLETNKMSIFSQVGTSEKPDIVTAKMLEGRVAIIVDGSPTVLTVPFVLFESYQNSEDYYLKSYRSSLIRAIRILAMFTAIMLPATYVAFQQFQYQMLPFKILIAIIDAVSTIPMSPVLEMMILLIMFEILSETSIRMPRYLGMALSIMGAIVLGETAVHAGIVSSPTILVTALSTIAIYCVPDESNAASLLRLVFVAVGGILGIFGIVIAGVFLIAYLCTLESLGIAYCAPLAPMLTHDWQDAILKDVTGKMTERPYTIPTTNRRRVKNADSKSKQADKEPK